MQVSKYATVVISRMCEVETDMLLSSFPAWYGRAQLWSSLDKTVRGWGEGGVKGSEDSHLFFNVSIVSRLATSEHYSSALQMTVRAGAS